jgi:hypothetical protein
VIDNNLLNSLDHLGVKNIDELIEIFRPFACNTILIKKLAKNNNDKNQVYIHSNPDFLNGLFDLTFGHREPSTSKKKLGTGLPIPEGVFNEFYWLDTEHKQHKVPSCKAIFYAQYPEVRLSGFKTESGTIPASMSVNFTNEYPGYTRFLALGGDREGKTYAVMVVEPNSKFLKDFEELGYHPDSKACKVIRVATAETASEQLKTLLRERIGGKSIKGCRLSSQGVTLPFNGTQVHGYTLEHELGIATNASKEGDIFGIELKCFTNKKLTLFTPEPDGGLYAESFDQFMRKYGYTKEAVYRFTGLHRVGTQSERSGLSLRVLCSKKGKADNQLVDYDPSKKFKDQLQNLQVVLMDDDDNTAASWSLTRLLGNWGIKHNEVVYVPATVRDNEIREEVEQGYKKRVYFDDEVLWCKGSSIEQMILAIVNGIIFLDPAPKLDLDNPKNNKRRSQWRLNNIYRDSKQLYRSIDIVSIK